ncbi:MAG: cyclic nucleotide-binding domain-containing protein [Gemmatimonas sp.]
MSDPVFDVVAGHPFTSGLDAHHVNQLASMAREMCFETGSVIFPEGDHSREFYLLVHGMVALEICSGSSQHRFQTLYANDEFGWSALMPDKGKLLQARALERVDVLVFDGPQLQAAFQNDPAFGLTITTRLLGVVAERLDVARGQLVDLYSTESRRAGT